MMSIFSRTHEPEAPAPAAEPTAAEIQAAEERRAAEQAQAREVARPARERVAEMVQRREAAEAAQKEHVAAFEVQQARDDMERRQRNEAMKAKAQAGWAAKRDELRRKVDEVRSQLSDATTRADSCYAAGDLDAAARNSSLAPVIQRVLAQRENELAVHLSQVPRFGPF